MIRQKSTFSKSPSARLSERRRKPILRFTPTAWAKLLFLRDAGDTEVGGFGIAAADDLLLIEDVQLVQQVCDVASVSFDDASVADFFDRQVDAGISLARCGRTWMHTHPGDSPQPSQTDEETFARAFGRTDWAVMFILACGGRSYARLRFHIGPGGDIEIPIQVDFTQSFAASDDAAWLAEYQANVSVPVAFPFAEREPDMIFDPWDDDLSPVWDRLFMDNSPTDKESDHVA